ncbi:MAG: hypothetical protein AAB855_04530 [Patescibacteria group bacterium]
MSIQERSAFEKAILRTIAFFDLFDYPLTDSEIAKFLFVKDQDGVFGVRDVRRALSSSLFLASRLEEVDGVYGLTGRAVALSIGRRERWVMAYRKYRRAKRIARLLARLPFVRMICVCNTLGLSAARDESDIDLFIVARAEHLWTVRLLCTGLVHALGLRPQPGRTRDAMCLSFYVSDTALDLSGLQLSDWKPDLYLAYWITWCVPIYDDNTYDRFFASNAWIRQILPGVIPHRPITRRCVRLGRVGRALKSVSEGIFAPRVFESGARAVQYRLFPPAIRNHMNQNGGVVVSPSILKFHINDRRQEIKERFLKKCEKLGV